MLLFDVKKILIREGLKVDIRLNYFDTLFFSPKYFIDSYNHVESVLTHSKNFIKQFKQRSDSNKINQKSLLPRNATIRKEYVKCGKVHCSRCRHGPYYYAYWGEKGRLKKKYIGINK